MEQPTTEPSQIRTVAPSVSAPRVYLSFFCAAVASGAIIGAFHVIVGIPFGYFVSSLATWWPSPVIEVPTVAIAILVSILLGGLPAATISGLGLTRSAEAMPAGELGAVAFGPVVMAIPACALLTLTTSPWYVAPFLAAAAAAVGVASFTVPLRLAGWRPRAHKCAVR